MKKILTLFLILSGSYFFAQKIDKENVPPAILKKFESSFGKAKNPKWELDFENYQVEFVIGKSENTVWYNKDAKQLKHSILIKPSELPKPVKQTLEKELGGLLSHYTYESTEKIKSPEKEDEYKVIVKKNEESHTFIVSKKGDLIKKEEDEKD